VNRRSGRRGKNGKNPSTEITREHERKAREEKRVRGQVLEIRVRQRACQDAPVLMLGKNLMTAGGHPPRKTPEILVPEQMK
jgi:hypothetical protein